MADTGPDKMVRRDSTLAAIEGLSALDQSKVKEYVDDDLLSCFIWAAGENAINPGPDGWESPKGGALAPEIESGQILSAQPLGDLEALGDPPGTRVGAPAVDGGVDSSDVPSALAGGGRTGGGGGQSHVNGRGSGTAAKADASKGTKAGEKRPAPAPAAGQRGLDDDDDDSGADSDDDGMGGGDGLGLTPMSKESKLLQRMQRKAESARIARLRKKEYVSGLEAQIQQLKEEHEALEKQIAAEPPTPVAAAGGQGGVALPGKAKTPVLKEAESQQLNQMHMLLKRPSVERLTPEIQATIEKYVNHKRKRFDTIAEYLDCIEEILQPGTPVQLAFGPSAALAAANNVPSDGGPLTKKHRRDSSAGTHLMEVLATELGITKEQSEKLQELRDAIRKDREILVESEAVVRELRARVQEHIGSSQGITDGLRKILTPQQIAKFIMWVEKNQRSMDMLNSFDWEMQLEGGEVAKPAAVS
mmetsp:Transcript_3740/g.10525  ORF Transcript_3740/g.10525 Transcript_3740/m.10525 type:complete len:474 (+) Transcript_3740:247-1668(+)